MFGLFGVADGCVVVSGRCSFRNDAGMTGTGGGRTASDSPGGGLEDRDSFLSVDIGAVTDRRAALPVLCDGRAPESDLVSSREEGLVFDTFMDGPIGEDPAASLAFAPLDGRLATSTRPSWIVRFPWCNEYSRRYSARSAQPPPTRTMTRSPFSPTRRT
jgi:hypothetical protein